MPSTKDEATGLPIHSLYGETRRPTDAMLQGIDTLVLDLQDVGVRFYTYAATMGYVLEEAAKRKIRVVVLDRPNPIGGWQIEGPLPDADLLSFIAYMPMPIRHGLTLGELAMLFNAERKIGADLTVVKLEGWRRDQWFDHTGLPWVNPSPNMRNLTQADAVPGRRRDRIRQPLGGPRHRPAVRADRRAVDRRPRPGRGAERARPAGHPVLPGAVHAGVERARRAGRARACSWWSPTARRCSRRGVGLEIAAALWRLHGDQFDKRTSERLLGSRADFARAKAGEDPAAIAAGWAEAEAGWRRLRAQVPALPVGLSSIV